MIDCELRDLQRAAARRRQGLMVTARPRAVRRLAAPARARRRGGTALPDGAGTRDRACARVPLGPVGATDRGRVIELSAATLIPRQTFSA